MSDKPAPKGTPGTAWNDPKVPGLRLRYLATKAVYYLFYRTKAGVQRNQKIGDEATLTLTKARELARDILARVAKGEDPAGEFKVVTERPTLKDMRDKHVAEHIDVRNKSSWANDQKGYWDNWVIPTLGADTIVAEVKPADISKLHHAMRETPYAANRCRSMLHKAFGLAESPWGWRPPHTNPCDGVEPYKEHKRKRLPDAPEAVRLLVALESMRADRPHFVALVELLLFTGARLREIMHAKWAWVKDDGLHLPDSKTGEKVVALSTLAREVLAGIPRLTGNPYIIVGRKPGRPLVSVKEPWRELCKRAGITERLTRHDLRRFFASAGLSHGGVTLDQIGGLLGHADAATTKRYAYLLTNAAQDHADATAEAVKGIMTNVVPFKKPEAA